MTYQQRRKALEVALEDFLEAAMELTEDEDAADSSELSEPAMAFEESVLTALKTYEENAPWKNPNQRLNTLG